jgi:hypothetical protein
MISIGVTVLTFVLLICCWTVGDQEFRTKVIFTLVYLASWGLIFFVDGLLTFGVQALLATILSYSTFGPTGHR